MKWVSAYDNKTYWKIKSADAYDNKIIHSDDLILVKPNQTMLMIIKRICN